MHSITVLDGPRSTSVRLVYFTVLSKLYGSLAIKYVGYKVFIFMIWSSNRSTQNFRRRDFRILL